MTPPKDAYFFKQRLAQPGAGAEAKVLPCHADRHLIHNRTFGSARGCAVGATVDEKEEVSMTEQLRAPHTGGGHEATPIESSERAFVRQQLEARRDFASHVFVFIVVNTAVVLIWAITGTGYFWPAWLIGAWGIGLVMHGWDAFIRRPVTEEDVDEAMRKFQTRR